VFTLDLPAPLVRLLFEELDASGDDVYLAAEFTICACCLSESALAVNGHAHLIFVEAFLPLLLVLKTLDLFGELTLLEVGILQLSFELSDLGAEELSVVVLFSQETLHFLLYGLDFSFKHGIVSLLAIEVVLWPLLAIGWS